MGSHITEFTANMLGKLDGGALGAELNRQVRAAVNDIIQRPTDVNGKPTKERKITLELQLSPRVKHDPKTQTDELVGINLEPKIKNTLPTVVGGVTDLRYVNGSVLYNSVNPDNFDQNPLPFPEEEEVEGEV